MPRECGKLVNHCEIFAKDATCFVRGDSNPKFSRCEKCQAGYSVKKVEGGDDKCTMDACALPENCNKAAEDPQCFLKDPANAEPKCAEGGCDIG